MFFDAVKGLFTSVMSVAKTGLCLSYVLDLILIVRVIQQNLIPDYQINPPVTLKEPS